MTYPRQNVSWSGVADGEPVVFPALPVLAGPARVYWAPIGRRRKPGPARCRTTSGRFRAGTRKNRRRERVRPRAMSGWRQLGFTTTGLAFDPIDVDERPFTTTRTASMTVETTLTEDGVRAFSELAP